MHCNATGTGRIQSVARMDPLVSFHVTDMDLKILGEGIYQFGRTYFFSRSVRNLFAITE